MFRDGRERFPCSPILSQQGRQKAALWKQSRHIWHDWDRVEHRQSAEERHLLCGQRENVFFGPLAERRPVFFGYCQRNKFVFLRPSAGGSSPVPASTCHPRNLSLLFISDMTSNLQECRVQREASINDWSAQDRPALPLCESRGEKKTSRTRQGEAWE